MKAIQIDGDRLIWAETPRPALGPGEVRIRVKASAVNRADLSQRTGGYPPPPGASPILGLECAGVIEEIAPDVAGMNVGDPVCALLAGGGHAEEVVVPAGQVLPIPRGLSFHEAAALPEVFATAYLNLYMEAALAPGERVLLHAGASGVGTAGIQLCRAFGNPAYVTAGADDKIARCVALGAAGGNNRHAGRFADQVAGWTDGRGFDVILDPVGAAYLKDNLESLALDGRLVLIGLMGGVSAELPMRLMLMKRLRVIGSTLRARPIAAKTAIMAALHQRVWPLIESGAIRPIVEAVIPIAETQKAHELIASDTTFGKVVLAVD
ncbi:MAG TPA: NAD(P)H-quinone oxidoreductase [Burkholderiaceae bacterium]|nr:NAD(P)H-quinone oxidoreductase [Burkholderiaceae bacterium]